MSNESSQTSTDDNNQENQFFDLHISGFGYLNRLRVVPVQRGKPFLAVDIAAIHGRSNNVQYTRFDCRVSGTEAQRIIEELKPIIKDESNKVLIGFKLGVLYVDPFTYQKGEKAGQPGVSLKTRLLRIEWVKVNGKVYNIKTDEKAA